MDEAPIHMTNIQSKTQIVTKVVKILISVLFFIGFALIFKNKLQHQEIIIADTTNTKSLTLKKYLLKFEKPERIEIFGLSDRFADDILQIKKLKISQDKKSEFYITIKLFSDETDKSAPLVAQIQFIDINSGNLRKEESINLE